MRITRNETSAPYGSSGDPHYLFDREGFGQNMEVLLEAGILAGDYAKLLLSAEEF